MREEKMENSSDIARRNIYAHNPLLAYAENTCGKSEVINISKYSTNTNIRISLV